MSNGKRKGSGSEETFAKELEGALHIKEQETIIDECEGWCKKILEIVDSDVLSVETEHFIDASLATKTTVGIMMKDGIVTNTLTGAPAAMSKKIKAGDKLLQIEGTAIDSHGTGATKLLIGDDIPGTIVTLQLQRGGTKFEVSLVRACTSELADRRRMFQLFTSIKDHALQVQATSQNNKAAIEIAPIVDETIDLWQKMLEADQLHDDLIVKNVEELQNEADHAVRNLRDLLTKLHSISKVAITNMSAIAQEESELFKQMKVEQDRAMRFEQEMKSWKSKYEALEVTHSKCDIKYNSLQMEFNTVSMELTTITSELKTLNVSYSSLQTEFNALTLAHSQCDSRYSALQIEFNMTTTTLTNIQMELKTLNVSYASLQMELNQLNALYLALQHKHSGCDATISALRAEHSPCAGIIADLRRQIQETKDALDEDDDTLMMHISTARTGHEQARVKLGSAPHPGRPQKLGAAPGARLPLPSAHEDVTVKEHGKVTLEGIAGLRQKIKRLEEEHAPCHGLIAQQRQEISQLTTSLNQLRTAHAPCADIKTKYDSVLRAHAGCANEMKLINSELRSVQSSYQQVQREHAGCASFIAKLQLQITSMTNQMAHKNNLCGVGLRISQFNPQELANGGITTTNDHGGRVWVSKVVPGGPASLNGLIKENDELVQIDTQSFDSVITAANLLRGAPDTTVMLTFQTPTGGAYSVSLVRALSRANTMALNYLQKEISVAQKNPYKDLPVLASYSNTMELASYASFASFASASDIYGTSGGDIYGTSGGDIYGSGKSNGTVSGNGLYGSARATRMGASETESMSSPRRMPGGMPRMLKQGRHVCSCKDCGSHFGNAFAAP